jgi:hypothetical protein
MSALRDVTSRRLTGWRKLTQRPVAHAGQVVIRPMLTLTATPEPGPRA